MLQNNMHAHQLREAIRRKRERNASKMPDINSAVKTQVSELENSAGIRGREHGSNTLLLTLWRLQEAQGAVIDSGERAPKMLA